MTRLLSNFVMGSAKEKKIHVFRFAPAFINRYDWKSIKKSLYSETLLLRGFSSTPSNSLNSWHLLIEFENHIFICVVLFHSYAVDLVICAALGADMFDCVYPTRTAVSVIQHEF